MDIRSDEILQARLEDWRFSGIQGFDFPLIVINTNDRMAEIRKACSRNKSHIARTNHRNMHLCLKVFGCLAQ
jgi:hypothetical protein